MKDKIQIKIKELNNEEFNIHGLYLKGLISRRIAEIVIFMIEREITTLENLLEE